MKSEEFMNFLNDEKKNSLERAAKLTADDRKDDANQCKIEANIYDIFMTLYQMAWQQAGADEVKVDAMFREKARVIPDSWRESLERAIEHGDTAKILAGQTKMSVVERVMKEYDKPDKKKIWKKEKGVK